MSGTRKDEYGINKLGELHIKLEMLFSMLF